MSKHSALWTVPASTCLCQTRVHFLLEYVGRSVHSRISVDAICKVEARLGRGLQLDNELHDKSCLLGLDNASWP